MMPVSTLGRDPALLADSRVSISAPTRAHFGLSSLVHGDLLLVVWRTLCSDVVQESRTDLLAHIIFDAFVLFVLELCLAVVRCQFCDFSRLRFGVLMTFELTNFGAFSVRISMPACIRCQSCVAAVGISGCLGCDPDVSLEGQTVGVQLGRAVPSAGVVRSTL